MKKIDISDLNIGDKVLVRVKCHDGDTFYGRVSKPADDSQDTPRDWDGNLGRMLCWSSRYDLGDSHSYENEDEFLSGLLYDEVESAPYFGRPILDFIESGKAANVRIEVKDELKAVYSRTQEDADWEYVADIQWPAPHKALESWLAAQAADYLSPAETMQILNDIPGVCILPLVLTDHSSLSMSVATAYEPGNIGFVYCVEDRAKELWCQDWPLGDTAWKERAKKEMTDEVALYDQYLGGDVFGIVVEKFIAHPLYFGLVDAFVEEDSCWGFYDNESANDYLFDNGREEFYALDEADLNDIRDTGLKAESANGRSFEINTPLGIIRVYAKTEDDAPNNFPGVYIDLLMGGESLMLSCTEFDSTEKRLMTTVYAVPGADDFDAQIVHEIGADDNYACEQSDNIGKMVCWKDGLGDAHSYEDAEDFFRAVLYAVTQKDPHFVEPVLSFVTRGNAKNVRCGDAEDAAHSGDLAVYARNSEDDEWRPVKYISKSQAESEMHTPYMVSLVAGYMTLDEIKSIVYILPDVAILPLYCKENSAAISTIPFDIKCEQVGYIYALREGPWNASAIDWKEQAESKLAAEVAAYSERLKKQSEE